MFKKFAPPIEIPDQYLSNINFSGLKGRLLYLPMPKRKSKTFVVLSGQHAAHERMYSIAQAINDYGEVYLPDLPGFGGMTSFYKIGKRPTWDNYADYLYTFLKTHNLREDIWFFASSFGAQVMTRMLEKYPDSQAWVKQPIAFVGFAAGSNFHMSKAYRGLILAISYPISTRPGAWLAKRALFNRLGLHLMLAVFTRTKAKMQSDDGVLKNEMKSMEGYLWTVNDKRTHAATAITMLRDDLRRYNKAKIKLKLHNITTDSDQYFDNERVRAAFLELYDKYETSSLNLHVHAPSLIADKAAVKSMLSSETLKVLKR